MLSLYFKGFQTIGTVDPSFISTIGKLSLMASTCRSQKSQPSVTEIAILSATRKLKSSISFPICTIRSVAPTMGTSLSLEFRMLGELSSLRILYRMACGISFNLIKMEHAPVSRMTKKRFVHQTIIPKLA